MKAFDALLSASVTIWPVSAKALVSDRLFDAESRSFHLGPVLLANPDVSVPLEIARRSGGKAYFSFDKYAKPSGESLSSSKGSYVLGFRVSEPPDSKFHPVTVSTSGQGVRLRYKPGYWHLAPTEDPLNIVEEDLRTALESPFTAGGILIQADATNTHNSRSTVSLFIDPSNIRLDQERGGWTGAFEFICAQKDNQDHVFATPPESFLFTFPSTFENQVSGSG